MLVSVTSVTQRTGGSGKSIANGGNKREAEKKGRRKKKKEK